MKSFFIKSVTVPAIVAILAISIIISVHALDPEPRENTSWYWYNKAVDLAAAGNFPAAFDANEKALAINGSMPVALANKAGILVQLGRYEEAIVAADKLLSASMNTSVANAAAYYSKADALKSLVRAEEAKAAYIRAHELDPELPLPDLPLQSPTPVSSPDFPPTSVLSGTGGDSWTQAPSAIPVPVRTKSQVGWSYGLVAVLIAGALFIHRRHV